MAMTSGIYAYPTKNSDLIKDLKLQKHPEGGYYAETGRWDEVVPSPFVNGAQRPLGTTIYYLLTADEPRGTIHRNLSNTMHVHHQGRATYTLIYPPTPASPKPVIRQVTMGTNAAAGETRQLFVGDCWKMSEIPAADLAAAKDGGSVSTEEVGCLITEVVVPGFVWEDHHFLTIEALEELFKNEEDGKELVERFKAHLHKV